MLVVSAAQCEPVIMFVPGGGDSPLSLQIVKQLEFGLSSLVSSLVVLSALVLI